jgi:arylsulfatase
MKIAALLLAAVVGSVHGGTLPQTATSRMNVVMLVIDDTRWDSIGTAGNPIVRTPRLDALSAEGIRFTQARVTTSICMTSRASLLTGQYMSRHGIDRFGKQLTPDAFALTYAGVLRSAGYWTGYVGKYDVGAPRPVDFDFLRAYHGRHWIQDAGGERVHVTEKNARDSVEFLRTRPRDKPFVLSVGYFAAHAEDSAKEQYLPQDWSAAYYKGVKVPQSPLAQGKYLEALPPFLSRDSNEGRVDASWRGCVLLEGEMSPCPMVVEEIRGQDTSQVPLLRRLRRCPCRLGGAGRRRGLDLGASSGGPCRPEMHRLLAERTRRLSDGP